MFGKAIQTLRIYDFNTKKDIIFLLQGAKKYLVFMKAVAHMKKPMLVNFLIISMREGYR